MANRCQYGTSGSGAAMAGDAVALDQMKEKGDTEVGGTKEAVHIK
jgi:hypothetical protein